MTLNVERLWVILSGRLYVSLFFGRQIRFWLLSMFPASLCLLAPNNAPPLLPCLVRHRRLPPHISSLRCYLIPFLMRLQWQCFSPAVYLLLQCVKDRNRDVFQCIHKLCLSRSQTVCSQKSQSVTHTYGPRPHYFFTFPVWNVSYFHFLPCMSHSLIPSLCVSLCAGSSRAAWVQTDVPCSLQNQGPSIMLTC